MTSRSYALILVAGAVTLFLGLAAANVVLDPWWVFRVSPMRHSTININDRYDHYRAYAAAPDRYEALLLSSSRGLEFSLDEMSRHANGETYARFAVSYGRLADHLAVLEFVMRDKAARDPAQGPVLLIDVDSLGEPPPSPTSCSCCSRRRSGRARVPLLVEESRCGPDAAWGRRTPGTNGRR